MPQRVLRAPQTSDGSGLARIWLDGATSFTAFDPNLFQLPATDGLAEWLERLALQVTAEDTYMQIADVDGMAVGHIWAAIRPVDADADKHMLRDATIVRLTVHWLGVAAGYRRQGIGTRLLQAAETWAISRGAQVAGFSTYLGAPAPLSFYEGRMGYARQAVFLRKALA